MKKILLATIVAAALMSCGGGANDGNPNTDTTTMPADTSMNKTQTDQINRNDGTINNDTSRKGNLSPDSISQNQSGKK
jgi:hypothetical protein